MYTIGKLLLLALDIYFWIIIVMVVTSWLIVFDVMNPKSEQAKNFMALLAKATDPVFKPLQKYIPPIGGIDITPIIVIIGIMLAKELVVKLFMSGSAVVVM